MGSARVAGDGAMRGLLSVCLSFFLSFWCVNLGTRIKRVIRTAAL